MKKIFLALVFVFGSAAFVTSNANPPSDEAESRVVMTSCDTYLFTSDMSDQEAAAWCDLLENLC